MATIFCQRFDEEVLAVVEEQRVLMKNTREYLEMVLVANEYMLYPDAGLFEIYKSYIAQLVLEYPNQETLALGLELMDRIYNVQLRNDIDWFPMIEQLTVILLNFTDLSTVDLDERQKNLMLIVRKSLAKILDSDNSLEASANYLDFYRRKLSKLAVEFPNQATLDLALGLMDMIYRAMCQKGFHWINDIERFTVVSLRFTDLSAIYSDETD